jgi:hypothetical protein
MRFDANYAGFAALRQSYKAEIKSRADQMAAAANAIPSTTDPAATEPYYEVFDASDGDRPRYRVAPVNIRAQRHEARTFALQRAYSSG